MPIGYGFGYPNPYKVSYDSEGRLITRLDDNQVATRYSEGNWGMRPPLQDKYVESVIKSAAPLGESNEPERYFGELGESMPYPEPRQLEQPYVPITNDLGLPSMPIRRGFNVEYPAPTPAPYTGRGGYIESVGIPGSRRELQYSPEGTGRVSRGGTPGLAGSGGEFKELPPPNIFSAGSALFSPSTTGQAPVAPPSAMDEINKGIAQWERLSPENVMAEAKRQGLSPEDIKATVEHYSKIRGARPDELYKLKLSMLSPEIADMLYGKARGEAAVGRAAGKPKAEDVYKARDKFEAEQVSLAGLEDKLAQLTKDIRYGMTISPEQTVSIERAKDAINRKQQYMLREYGDMASRFFTKREDTAAKKPSIKEGFLEWQRKQQPASATPIFNRGAGGNQ